MPERQSNRFLFLVVCIVLTTSVEAQTPTVPGSVVFRGVSYGLPPSEIAFEKGVDDVPAHVLQRGDFRVRLIRFGHFYCSLKPVNTNLSDLGIPENYWKGEIADPVRRRDIANKIDDIISARILKASAAWREIGGTWIDGDEVTWANLVASMAEKALCPDYVMNIYSAKSYSPR